MLARVVSPTGTTAKSASGSPGYKIRYLERMAKGKLHHPLKKK